VGNNGDSGQNRKLVISKGNNQLAATTATINQKQQKQQ